MKKSQKMPSTDIAKAEKIRKAYFNSKNGVNGTNEILFGRRCS